MNDHTAPQSPRGVPTFSLRAFFVALTALAIWLGIVVNRAHEQREAVKAIRASGGGVAYDWQFDPPRKEPWGPRWIRRIIGNHFFQNVTRAYILPGATDSDILKVIPHLKRLRRLREIWYSEHVSETTRRELKAALPNCEGRAVSFQTTSPNLSPGS